MKKKVLKAEEEAASLQQKAKIKHEEAEKLRKKLELAHIGDTHHSIQQQQTPLILQQPLINSSISGTTSVSNLAI